MRSKNWVDKNTDVECVYPDSVWWLWSCLCWKSGGGAHLVASKVAAYLLHGASNDASKEYEAWRQ